MIKIKNMLKNFVLSTISIYSINLFVSNLGLIVPINYFSILFTSILGFPGLLVYTVLSMIYL